jgi:hypothetical protein
MSGDDGTSDFGSGVTIFFGEIDVELAEDVARVGLFNTKLFSPPNDNSSSERRNECTLFCRC